VKDVVRFIAIDDPSVGLDDDAIPLLLDIVRNVREGSAVIITSREKRLVDAFREKVSDVTVIYTNDLHYREMLREG